MKNNERKKNDERINKKNYDGKKEGKQKGGRMEISGKEFVSGEKELLSRKEKELVSGKGLIPENIKSDFIRQFTFYLVIILALTVVAYLFAILPSLLSSQQSTMNQSLSNLFENLSKQNQSIYLEEQKCNISMTEDSKYYDVKYKIIINTSIIRNTSTSGFNGEVGFVDYKTIKQDNGYLRTMQYSINSSSLASLSTNKTRENSRENPVSNPTSNSTSAINLFVITYYDKEFNCINSSLVMYLNNTPYSQPYYCPSPDIPLRVCKENLVEISKEEIKTDLGLINVTNYNFTVQSGQASTQNLSMPSRVAFSDLPFPVLMEDSETRLELVNYSKIE